MTKDWEVLGLGVAIRVRGLGRVVLSHDYSAI